MINLNKYLKFPDRTPDYLDIRISLLTSPSLLGLSAHVNGYLQPLAFQHYLNEKNKKRNDKYTDEGHN